MSERHIWSEAESDIIGGMHVLHTWDVLRISGSAGSYRCMRCWLFLWGRQLYLDTSIQSIIVESISRELCGRDMFVGEERYVERRVSRGSLLSCGQLISGALSSRHELYISGSRVGE